MYEQRQNRYSKKPFNKAPKGGETQPEEILPHQPIQAKPLEIVVYGNFERAFRAFKSLVQKERILSDFKEKQSFEKPSDKKRRKKNEAKRKLFEESFKRDDKPRKPRNMSKKVLIEEDVNE